MSSDNRSIMFRIGNKTFSGLKSEAERNQVSLNTLVNQVLQQHLDWHAHAVKAGQVPIPKGLITSFMNTFHIVSKFSSKPRLAILN